VNERIHWRQADLLQGQPPASLELLCANLPYIPSADLADLPVARFEPRLALDGGPDGLALLRRLLAQAGDALLPGGLALLEIEQRQGQAAQQLAAAIFPQAGIRVLPDLAGCDRLLRIDLPQR
jgi:release factor glutamine methyltransferase